MPTDDARVWLRDRGYDGVADQIDGLIARWKLEGKRTRRNWWDILAGDLQGRPRRAGGIEFPVLRAAQVRQGRVMRNGVIRDRGETAPPIRVNGRWPSSKKK